MIRRHEQTSQTLHPWAARRGVARALLFAVGIGNGESTRAISFNQVFDSLCVTYVVESEDNGTFFLEMVIYGLDDVSGVWDTLRVRQSGRGVVRKGCQRVEVGTDYILGEVIRNVSNLNFFPST